MPDLAEVGAWLGTVPTAFAGLSDWITVGLVGILVGVSDLIGRHPDAPGRALVKWPAPFYIALNAGVSLLALGLARALGWVPGAVPTGGNAGLYWFQLIAIGIGAMTILRTSIAVGTGEQRITISLSTLLQKFLDAADTSVSRGRAVARNTTVDRLMKRVDFDQASTELAILCIKLVRRVDPASEKTALQEIAKLQKARNMRASSKTRLLGLILVDLVGEGVLEAAITALYPDTSQTGPARKGPLASGPTPEGASPVTGPLPVLSPPDAPNPATSEGDPSEDAKPGNTATRHRSREARPS